MTSETKLNELRALVDAQIPAGGYLSRIKPAAPATPPAQPEQRTAVADDADAPDLHRNAPRPDPACLYGLIGRIAEAGSATTEANPYAIALNALVYLSGAIGRGPFLPVGNTWHHGNLFALHIGRSGRGRKGDAASLVHRIDRAIRERQPDEAVNVWRSGLSSREGLVMLIHDGYRDGKNEVEPINDKRLCVFESEFVNVLHQGKRDGNTLSAALRDAWDGVSIKPATKTAKVGVTDPHIAVMGAVTPSELRSCMAARELTNGFANRFLMIFAERQRVEPFPEATSQAVVNDLAAEVLSVLGFVEAGRWVDKDTKRVTMSPAARELYGELYRSTLNAEIGGPTVAPLLERRAPVLLRIAMILALTDFTTEIEPKHLNAAHAWVRYWTETVLFVFSEAVDEDKAAQISEVAARILDFLRRHDRATRWEISRDCLKGHAKKDQIDAALDELLGSSPPVIEVTTAPRETGPGSPTKFYRLAAKSAKSAESEKNQRVSSTSHSAKSAKSAKSGLLSEADSPDFADHTSQTSHASQTQKQRQVIDFIETSRTSQTSHAESDFAWRTDDDEVL